MPAHRWMTSYPTVMIRLTGPLKWRWSTHQLQLHSLLIHSSVAPKCVGCGKGDEMASLNKLAIRGIRSFDDKHVQVIEFYSPLTVIVGHNGSGKTTIIECLKYSTTGQMPPNAKVGGAFIHDPKMANEKEVKAQVRLRFWNVNRQRMTVTRNVSVTMGKKGNLTMKTLEGLLAKSDPGGEEGKRNTISTKCAEMDEEVPLLMGVSPSILENVIFCHQEDSNWPMSEPSVLKKKFDDIFEATKYTKALDNIKALRKERVSELKVDRERLSFLKSDKDKAERMRRELEEQTRRENSKETEAERLKEEFEELKEQNMRYADEATSFNTIYERVERLTESKKMHEDNRKSISEGMREMSETTEELKDMLKNFDQSLKTIEAKKAKQTELRNKEDTSLEQLRGKERELASTHGGLIAHKRNHERHVREREAAIKEAAKTWNIAGFDYSPIEEGKISGFVDRLQEMVRKAESDAKRLHADGARKERELQAELDRLASSKTTAVATKQSKQAQIAQLNDKIRHSESAFDSVSSVDVEIELLESKIAEAREQQARLEQDIREAKYDEQLRDKLLAIRQKEAEKDKTNAELSALNRQADSRAQLSIKRSELTAKNGQINASVSSHSARYKELVGADLVAESMEDKLLAAASKRDRDVQEAESSSSAADRDLSQLQASLNIAKASLKSKTDEAHILEGILAEGLKESGKIGVTEAMDEADLELKLLRDSMNNKQSQKNMWESMLRTVKSKKKCMGCNRGVDHAEEAAVLAYIEASLHKTASSETAELKEDEKGWLTELDRLRGLLVSEKTLKVFKDTEIPTLEKQVKEESEKLEALQQGVEQAKDKLQKAKLAARDVQTLRTAATLVTRTLNEMKDLKSDISRLERDLESTGSLKTVEEVQAEVDHLSNEIKNLQRDQGALSAERELKTNSVRAHSDDINKKTLRLGELKNVLERRKREEAALEELRQSLAALQAELKTLDAAASGAEAPWRAKNEEMNRYRAQRVNDENEATLQAGLYQSSLNEVDSKHRAVQSHVTEGNERKIRENESQMEDVKREISSGQAARNAIDAAISTLQSELGQASSRQNNISANLRYRSTLADIKKVQEEIDSIDLESAARSRKEFNKKFQAKTVEENRVQAEWHRASGQLLQMKENREKLQQTLKADYKDIDKLFKEQLIKTKVGEFANNDLEKYGKALDNAILKYHSIKMDEINDTIGHLWNKTYQGTDIDNVRIVSDHDEEASTSTRKSYNYRVVMVKNDVELDMRGRCSAGQKVLASIIIRLALAESFGQGCGVLALDEPTTNLDQENINALAEALAEIIRERRRQANFQLIVITHDEGFLQRLAAHDVLEYYWRVSRDASQKSVLERQRVSL